MKPSSNHNTAALQLCASLLFFLASSAASSSVEADKPNIVIIYTDDKNQQAD